MKKIEEKKIEEVNKIKKALGKDYSNYVENAINEILYGIYRTSETEELYDKMIDDIGTYIKNKLNIQNDESIEWTRIGDWYWEWSNSLTYYLDIKEIAKILGSIKIKDGYGWEEPYGKIDIETIQKKIYKSMIESIEDYDIDTLKKEFLCQTKQ